MGSSPNHSTKKNKLIDILENKQEAIVKKIL